MDQRKTAQKQRGEKKKANTPLFYSSIILAVAILCYAYWLIPVALIIPNTFLVTMVKNERHILPRMLQSVSSHLQDPSWVLVCDTGSTDGTWEWLGTQKVLRVRQPWSGDFSFNRNACLKTATALIQNRTSAPEQFFILFLDADHTLKVNSAATEVPLGDLNMIALGSSWSHRLPYFVSWRAAKQCQYRLVTHEYLDCPETISANHTLYNGFSLHHHADGSRRNNGEKFLRDFDAIKKAMGDKNTLPTDNRRYAFYLARTLEDLQDFEQALPWYLKRARGGGWIEEAFFAQYRAALCMIELNYTKSRVRDALVKATQMLPYRIEPFYHLAVQSRHAREWPQCVHWCAEGTWRLSRQQNASFNGLFIDNDIYAWKLRDEFALCLYYSGSPKLARYQWENVIRTAAAPASQLARIKRNLLY